MTIRRLIPILGALVMALPTIAAAGVATLRIPLTLTGLPAGTSSAIVNCYVMDSSRELGTGAGGGSAEVPVDARGVSTLVRVALRRDTSTPLARPSTRYLCRISLLGSGDGLQAWSVEGGASPCTDAFCGLGQDGSGARRAVALQPAAGSPVFRPVAGSLPPYMAEALERPGMGDCPCGCGRTDNSNSAGCRKAATGVPKIADFAPKSDPPPRALPRTVEPQAPAPRSPKAPPPPPAAPTEPDKAGFPSPYFDVPAVTFTGAGALTIVR